MEKEMQPKKTCYEMATERIIAIMDKGIIPWKDAKMSVDGLRVGAYTHDDRAGGKPFMYLNELMQVPSGEYVTFKQCNFERGRVVKGSKCVPMFFFGTFEAEVKNDMNQDVKKRIPILRYLNHFNINDTTGIESRFEPQEYPSAALKTADRYKELDKRISLYLEETGIAVSKTDAKGCLYNVLTDSIQMPMKKSYAIKDEYYRDVISALIHSTGHESRLKRQGVSECLAVGKNRYTLEGLVAEMGVSAVANYYGIPMSYPGKNYLQNWSIAMSNSPQLVVKASQRAVKAVTLFTTGYMFKKEQAEPAK